MKVNAEAVRPGSQVLYQEKSWRVLSNDTLNRQLILEDADGFGTVQSYEPGFQFDCVDVPHRRDAGMIEDFALVLIVLMVIAAFIVIVYAAVQVITGDDSENRQSCLERNGSILEDESGNMTGCIIDRERP